MRTRVDLQYKLEEILGDNKVYFQPPTNLKMSYPCIRYSMEHISVKNADDINYYKDKSYTITLITYDPDSDLVDKIMNLPRCIHIRSYTADNLNHYIFRITL